MPNTTLNEKSKITLEYLKTLKYEEITDEIINKYFWKENGSRIRRSFKSLPKHILDYLNNRYIDSESYQETIIRIYSGKFETRPKCPICGKSLPYLGYGIKRGIFPKGCSVSCSSKYSGQKYIEEHGYSKESIGQDLRRKRRDELGIPYQNVEKWKSTMIKKYGTTSILDIPGMKEKIIKNNLKKYGVEHSAQAKIVKEKIKNTCIKKYGVSCYFKTEKAKQRTSEIMKGNKEIQAKREKTMLERHGATTPFHTKEYYDTHDLSAQAYKGHLTKLKTGAYKMSKQEEESYHLLKEIYPDVIREYKDELRYPFNCDFYIPSLDLFIECQYHWTHNGHPYDQNNENDIKDAEFLLNEGHEGAWHTWTIRDVKKRNTAKENNLNYLEIWTTEELKEWIESQK